MTENPALEALTEALHQANVGCVHDPDLGTVLADDRECSEKPPNFYQSDTPRTHHQRPAAAILAALTASGHAIVTAAEAEAGRAVLALPRELLVRWRRSWASIGPPQHNDVDADLYAAITAALQDEATDGR